MVSVSLPLPNVLGLKHALMEVMRSTAVSYLYILTVINLIFQYVLNVTICTASCQNGAFWCSSDQCISSSKRCNGVRSCSDGSDEMNCSKFWQLPTDVANSCGCISTPFVTISTASCQSGAFHCGNGQCVLSSGRCDSHQDCSDGSDETGCSKLLWFI